MAKKVSEMTPKEYREKLIKDRAARLARDAAKQGITPAELAKKKRDTYLNVVGGAVTMIPIARVLQLANTAYKAYKGAGAATKVAQATKTGTKATKTAAKTKPASTKTTAKKKTPTTAAASKVNRATSQGGRTAAQARQATKTKPASKSKAAQSKTTAKSKSRKMTPASSTRVDRAARALLGGAATSVALTAMDAVRKSGKGKTQAATVASPISRPKRPTKSTGMSEGNTVAGSSGRRSPKGPGVGRTDKSDKRKDFASKATPGAKKVAPTPKRKPKDTFDKRGDQIKGISSLPAGALRKFQGSYNKKKEKLRNIGGKTYVVKR